MANTTPSDPYSADDEATARGTYTEPMTFSTSRPTAAATAPGRCTRQGRPTLVSTTNIQTNSTTFKPRPARTVGAAAGPAQPAPDQSEQTDHRRRSAAALGGVDDVGDLFCGLSLQAELVDDLGREVDIPSRDVAEDGDADEQQREQRQEAGEGDGRRQRAPADGPHPLVDGKDRPHDGEAAEDLHTLSLPPGQVDRS